MPDSRSSVVSSRCSDADGPSWLAGSRGCHQGSRPQALCRPIMTTKRKPAAIAGDKPVKMAVEQSAGVHRDLLACVEAISRETGRPPPAPNKLVGLMFRRFMPGDRAFGRNLMTRTLPGLQRSHRAAIDIDNKNLLFAGSHRGREGAAASLTLIGTAKLNRLDPEARLRDVPAPTANHPANRIGAILPLNLKPHAGHSATSEAARRAARRPSRRPRADAHQWTRRLPCRRHRLSRADRAG